MRGANQADVHGDGGVAAQPLKAAVVEHAQQLGLQSQGQIANLIQEQRAAVGGFKPPAAHGHGPGKGALFVAKQFVFHQVLGQIGAGKGNERRRRCGG